MNTNIRKLTSREFWELNLIVKRFGLSPLRRCTGRFESFCFVNLYDPKVVPQNLKAFVREVQAAGFFIDKVELLLQNITSFEVSGTWEKCALGLDPKMYISKASAPKFEVEVVKRKPYVADVELFKAVLQASNKLMQECCFQDIDPELKEKMEIRVSKNQELLGKL